MHSYFPNADLNLWLNFNFAKLVKRETLLCGFAKVGLKGVENILECGMRYYFPNAYLNLRLNFNFEKLVKRETLLCGFAKVGLKRGWKYVSKVCMHACWSNWHPNLWSNLNSKKLLERETLSCGFNRVAPKGGQNGLKRREILRASLSIKYASKHIIRFKF